MTTDSLESSIPAAVPGRWADWVRLLRPHQWVKNLFVVAPLLFSGRLAEGAELARAGLAFVVFCALASGVYAWNDVADRVGDRAHPVKRRRPVAAGRIAPAAALAMGTSLWLLGLTGAWLLGPRVALFALLYLGLNLAYSFALKRVVLLDVFCLAAFFLLRLLAGSAAVMVAPSIWLLLCGGLLALYLGFAKRRHELLLLEGGSADHRAVLTEYSPAFLDQMSVVLLSVTLVAYLMYTVSPERVAEVGHRLTYSTVFVLYGVFRYLYLVHQRQGGSPTEALLTDRALLLDVILWVGYCGWVIYRPAVPSW